MGEGLNSLIKEHDDGVQGQEHVKVRIKITKKFKVFSSMSPQSSPDMVIPSNSISEFHI